MQPSLHIDLDAVAQNWRRLDAASAPGVETGAVVKADAYGLGVARVAPALARAGARTFFVALAEEGAVLRRALGPGPVIFVFAGHMAGDARCLSDNQLVPLLNSPEQVARHFAAGDQPFGVQLDSGMNRLGLEPADFAALRARITGAGPRLLMSHLACADDPDHEANSRQLSVFREMTADLDAPLSLSATAGILLGTAYHFDLCRPGIGLYGGLPFADALPVVVARAPVIQVRSVAAGEFVGYGATLTTTSSRRIATVAVGYADGFMRHLSNVSTVGASGTRCRVAGRVSMDLLTIDVTDLDAVPDTLEILGPGQSIDDLAAAAGTIGYEVLTSLGARYARVYSGAATGTETAGRTKRT